jgi:hypothetical protein
MPNTVSRLNRYASFLANAYDEISQTNIKLSGVGTYFASDFTDGNVGITTKLVANKFKPYDILNGQFSHVTYTPGLGVYMRHNKGRQVEVYNEIDEHTLTSRYAIVPSKTTVTEGEAIDFDVFGPFVSIGTTVYYEVVSPQIVTITPSTTDVSLGGSLFFTVDHFNLGIGNTYYYSLDGVGITTDIFEGGSLTGSFITTSTSLNKNYVNLGISSTYSTYSQKFFSLSVRNNSTSGNIISTSPIVTIFPRNLSVNVSASSTSVTSGTSVTFTVTVTGSTSGSLFYIITGDVTNSYFSDGLMANTFNYSNATAQVTKTMSLPVGVTTTNYTFSIRSSSKGGTLSSTLITVNPVSAISTWSDFNSLAVSGQTINLLGQSGTTRPFTVTTVPTGAFAGTKAIAFPVTWPSTFYNFANQNSTYSYSMSSTEFAKFQDVDYIFNGRYWGVYPISGSSESCCDPYSLEFDGTTLFTIRGLVSNTFQYVTFNGTITNNSGVSRYITDFSVNSGNGLTGATGNFYLF